ncbi:MAG: hypothetical protein HOY79_48885 [Streptomyces sp.]|nr:hypothetical protein [Streptomyces sp.]
MNTHEEDGPGESVPSVVDAAWGLAEVEALTQPPGVRLAFVHDMVGRRLAATALGVTEAQVARWRADADEQGWGGQAGGLPGAPAQVLRRLDLAFQIVHAISRVRGAPMAQIFLDRPYEVLEGAPPAAALGRSSEGDLPNLAPVIRQFLDT